MTNNSSAFNHENQADEILHESISKLQQQGAKHATSKYGLSGDFKSAEITEEQAIKMCENAMEALASEYVQHLVEFKEADDVNEALQHLENSEVIWQSESSVIRHFDPTGEEGEFLNRVREMALQVTENKLQTVADKTSKSTSAENMALCIALLGVMDQIYSEFGYDKSSSERQKFRDIARSFQ